MPEVTDLMRVAQYVKSDKTAPSDVYNAACRMLDQPDEVEQLRAELAEAKDDVEIGDEKIGELNGITVKLEKRAAHWERKANAAEAERDEAHSVAEKWFNIAINDGRVIESVRQYAAELRTYNSPAGIASVYADALDALLPPRDAESNGDGRTGAPATPETHEAHGGSQ